MLASVIKAILEWLSGLVRGEIKQDVKAADAETPKEVVDEFRAEMLRKLADSAARRKLRNHEGGVHSRDEGRSEDRSGGES
tara:strand:+ start:422 stop:664 length:243 start_codon:yes stop_codon:yes gene_type:complete